MKNLLMCLLGITLLCSGGCSSKLGNFTVLSSKNVNLGDFSTVSGAGGEKVRGEDTMTFVILAWNKPMIFLKEAVDDSLDKSNAYMLTDATLRHECFWALLVAQSKFVAEGHPVKR